MNFIDKTKVTIAAGKGGDGKMSFRQEKFVDKGGPDGGDGGRGGHVTFMASRNHNTLAAFRYQRELQAAHGQGGGQNNKHGRNGKDLIVQVPVGTIVTDIKTQKVLADLTEDGQQVIIAKGGNGGFGNAHFVSSRRQTPRFAEKGEPGVAMDAVLELKMIADVGLVGLPNAGKSTLLSVISNARPEIADYPFTTLRPNLGVVDIDNDTSLLVADIPGLIEGAAEGKGLGHEFLRHIERTAVILHLIDAYQDDIAATYTTVQQELAAYASEGVDISLKPQIVVINKIEGLDAEIVDDLIKQLRSVVPEAVPIYAISAAAKQGLKELKYVLRDAVLLLRAVVTPADELDGIPVLRLTEADRAPWSVIARDGAFFVTGSKIERFAARTEFSQEEGVQRLRDIMKRMGVLHALMRQGVLPNQRIYFGEDTSAQFIEY